MSNKIFKVIKIVDEYTLVISAGAQHAIKANQVFEIYEPGDVIKDPETGEDFGTLDIIKVNIVVKNVLPKVSICTNQARNSSLASAVIAINDFGSSPEKFNIDPIDISGPVSANKKIKIGDLVRTPLG